MRGLLYKLASLLQGTKISFSVELIGIDGISIGTHCRIDPYCYLKSEQPFGKLILGNDVIVNRYSHISAKNSNIEILDHSYVGYNNWIGGRGNIIIMGNFMSGMNVVIISSNHNYEDIKIPYYSGDEITRNIQIEKDVWIGANSVILPGVRIGQGSVIGSGSIVSHDIPPNVIVAGNPAKIIKEIAR